MLSKNWEIWGFLCKSSKISGFKEDKLLKCCTDLQLALTVGSESDIEAVYLCDELIGIQHITKINDCNTPLDIVVLVKK